MSHPINDNSLGTVLFPEYSTLYDLVASEVQELSSVQLDFESDLWIWSQWSIRRQLSHMASLIYRWLLVRWGDTLFPEGNHGVQDVSGLANSKFDRRLDETRYWSLKVIMEKLRIGIELAENVLSEHTVGFLKRHTYLQDQSHHWNLMLKAHPSGIIPSGEPRKGLMTLEATMRHIYFEEITHLYNVQRLKMAQGLQTVEELPRVGYWVLEGWDTSEPE